MRSQGIKYEDIAYGSGNGFASPEAKNGRNGTTLVTALDNEEVVVDYPHRSYALPSWTLLAFQLTRLDYIQS